VKARARAARFAALAAVATLAGCATHAQLAQQDYELRGLVRDQKRQIEQLEHEVERLRADTEERPGRRGGSGSTDDRITALEQRIAALEQQAGVQPGPPAGPEIAPGPPPPTPPAKPAPLPPPAPEEGDEWHKDVVREQASAGAINAPERAEYLGILDGLLRKDCARAVPQLNGFASNHKDSPLADNALYWAARCYQLKGDPNQAISKFYDVVTRYPKGDKTPAALWAQGNLFIEIGDTPDARLALSKLIRDYPQSDEAARARQKLTDLER
jgi:tol-pal system protein YbgF